MACKSVCQLPHNSPCKSQCGADVCNTTVENSSFCLCEYASLQQGHVGSKSLLQQNPPDLNWGCLQTQVDPYNDYKIVVVVVLFQKRIKMVTGCPRFGWRMAMKMMCTVLSMFAVCQCCAVGVCGVCSGRSGR